MCYNNLRCRFPVQNNFHRGIAQLVEQWSPKPRAEGSNPSAPANFSYRRMSVYAAMAQVVERVLGKDEVTSSNLVSSSTITVLFV